MFQKLFKGYILYLLVHSDGRCVFELYARETNLKKKHRLNYCSNIYTVQKDQDPQSRAVASKGAGGPNFVDEEKGTEGEIDSIIILAPQIC